MQRLNRWLALVTVAILLGSIVLVGCQTAPKPQEPAKPPASTGEASKEPPKEPAKTEKKVMSLATASVGGTYYPVGVAMAEIINKYCQDVDMRVEITGGAIQNNTLIDEGQCEIGITNAHLAYFAMNAMEPYKKKAENLRGFFTGLMPGTVQYAVLKDSPIKSIKDFRGKRIAVGPAGGGGIVVIQHLLEYYGITFNDIKPSYVSFSEGISGLVDGNIDAALAQAGLPTPAIQELAATGRPFRIISMTDEERDAFLKKHPYYTAIDIPKEMYGLGEVVKTIATVNMVEVNKNLSEDLVYRMMKAIFDHIDELYAAHPATKSVKLETAWKLPIPLHPGAEKYYKEKGVIK